MFKRVFDLIRKEDIVLFIGAGFSLKAGYASGSKLSKIICDDLNKDIPVDELKDIQNQTLPIITERYIQIRNGSRNSLLQLLKQEYIKEPVDLSNQQIVWNIPHFHTIITTNYDTTFEKVYGNRCNVIVNDADCPYINSGKVSIYKVHGDLNQPDSIIIAQSDYTRFFDSQKNPVMWNLVKSIIATKSILFIGYGYEDSNIESIFSKLIETVGSNHKEFFLIAPDMPNYKISYLNRNGITYLNAKAENFLEELIIDIKENIKDDYEKKLITTETFNKFCNNHNISISVSIGKDKNVIDEIKPLGDNLLETKLSFSVLREVGQKIQNYEFQENNSELPIIHGVDFSKMPFIKIEPNELLSFRHTENDIVFHQPKDISALFVIQVPCQRGKISIILPNNQVYLDMDFEIYRKNEHFFIAKIYTPLFEYKAELSINKNNLHLSGTPNFNKHYLNKLQATYWTNLLCGLCRGGEVSVVLNTKEHKITFPNNEKSLNQYVEMIEYYNRISEIEKMLGEQFTIYECYTYENNIKAQKILCYLTKTAYRFHSDDRKIKLSVKLGDDFPIAKAIDKNEKYFMSQSILIREPYILNEKYFNIKYENQLLPSCSIISFTSLEDDTYTVEIESDDNIIPIFYSDNPIKEVNGKISFI